MNVLFIGATGRLNASPQEDLGVAVLDEVLRDRVGWPNLDRSGRVSSIAREVDEVDSRLLWS